MFERTNFAIVNKPLLEHSEHSGNGKMLMEILPFFH
jgi:hypothetical protein